jgi:protoheme IX farnesyltransferase
VVKKLPLLLWDKLNAYQQLMKPKVLLLMVTTSWVGMFLAPHPPQSFLSCIAISFGIFFTAAAGAVLNHFFDRHADARMKRTAQRPLVIATVTPKESLILSTLFLFVGSFLLLKYANFLTLILTLLGSFGYCFIYTLFLKYATPQNIAIGGLYGSLPPLLGWASLTNTIAPDALLLVGIIFTWTPPHFWALALDRVDEYKVAGVPMLPVTHGHQFTSFSMVLYTLLLFPVSLLPCLTGLLSYRYGFVATLLNVFYLIININVLKKKNGANRKSFLYSISYLYLLFITMILDKSIQ